MFFLSLYFFIATWAIRTHSNSKQRRQPHVGTSATRAFLNRTWIVSLLCCLKAPLESHLNRLLILFFNDSPVIAIESFIYCVFVKATPESRLNPFLIVFLARLPLNRASIVYLLCVSKAPLESRLNRLFIMFLKAALESRLNRSFIVFVKGSPWIARESLIHCAF